MWKLNLADLDQYSDLVRTRRGEAVTLRFVTPADADAFQAYVRGLSAASRYKRFFGAISELPKAVLDDFTHTGRDDRFSLVASMSDDHVERIVGEARYAFHPENGRVEFGLSVLDRWQGHGIGPALLQNLECRAAALGAVSMFGDTLRSNDVMIRLAKQSGYAFRQHPDDWKLVRFEKQLAQSGAGRSCASLRLVATTKLAGEPPAG